jgi:hypothetical protein
MAKRKAAKKKIRKRARAAKTTVTTMTTTKTTRTTTSRNPWSPGDWDALPHKGTRVRARADIRRTQGGPQSRPITIPAGAVGEVVSDRFSSVGIAVIFDEPRGNYIQWTGPHALDQFVRDVEIEEGSIWQPPQFNPRPSFQVVIYEEETEWIDPEDPDGYEQHVKERVNEDNVTLEELIQDAKRYGIEPRGRNDGTKWWESYEDREYDFHRNVSRIFTMHVKRNGKDLSPEDFKRINRLINEMQGGRTKVANPRAPNPFTLSKTDKAVIRAFTEGRAAESDKLSTDGIRLDGLWMGGLGIAEWRGKKIRFHDIGSKAAEVVQRAVRREAPKNDLVGGGTGWTGGHDPTSNPRGKHIACGSELTAKECRQLQHVYESAQDAGYSAERSAKQAWGSLRRNPRAKLIRVPSAWLRPGMIVKAPKTVGHLTWKRAWGPGKPTAPDRLLVVKWDDEEGRSELATIKADGHPGAYVDYNTNDYPNIWFVEANSISDLDEAARRQGQYPPDYEGNPKLYSSDLRTTSFEALPREFKIHTVNGVYPASIINVSGDEMTVNAYPFGTLRVVKRANGIFLVDPSVGGSEKVTAITVPEGNPARATNPSPRAARMGQRIRG